MTNRHRHADKSSTDNKSERSERMFSDEAIDRLKRAILLGEPIPTPPKSTRFQKGQSGNPKGRPKKTSSFPFHPRIEPQPIQKLILQEAERSVNVREGENVSAIAIKQAVLRAQINSALKGNAYAQKNALERIERIEREESVEIEQDHEFWRAYQERCWQEIAEAKSKGEPTPLHLPHPDDIILRPGKRPLFKGPMSEVELGDMELRIKLMDACILQSALNERCAPPGEAEEGRRRADAAMIFVALLNLTLPKRLQLSDAALTMKLMYFQNISKRVLLKSTRAAWGAAGVRVPRGKIFPELEFALTVVDGFKAANANSN